MNEYLYFGRIFRERREIAAHAVIDADGERDLFVATDAGPLHGHGHVAPCHSNRMILNENCMAVGIAMHASVAHRFLAQDGAG